VVDLSFWGANILKIPHGGWFPLLVGAVIFTLMSTWKKGRQILASRLKKGVLPLDLFIREMKEKELSRVPGTAVFMYSDPRGTPPALLHAIKHFKVLHERVAFLAVETEEEPHVPDGERVRVEELGKGFYRVVLRYGFMEEPDVLEALGRTRLDGADLKPLETTYVLGRETLISAERPGMARWREHLFAVMSRNARTATSFFGLPPNRVVELGMQIEI
jgi:KUP system potassium uptake protein